MLYEDDIIKAVCDHLRVCGYTVTQSCRSIECGDDIIAIHPSGLELFIEAKGETSAQSGSSRHGRAFTRSQVLVHVGQAFYRAAAMLQQAILTTRRRAGIALPDNAHHRERVAGIEEALRQLGIAVFWVRPDRSVTVWVQPDLPDVV